MNNIYISCGVSLGWQCYSYSLYSCELKDLISVDFDSNRLLIIEINFVFVVIMY